MGLVRDLIPDDAQSRRLDLRTPMTKVVPGPARPRARGPVIPLDGSGGRRSYIGPLARMLRARISEPAKKTARESVSPRNLVVVDFGRREEQPTVKRIRPALPFVATLALASAVILLSVASARLLTLGESVTDRTALALEQSRAGLSALALSQPAEAAAHFATAQTTLAETDALLARISVGSALSALSPAEHSELLLRAADEAVSAGAAFATALQAVDLRDTRTAFLQAEAGFAHLHAADLTLASVGPLVPARVRPAVTQAKTDVHALLAKTQALDAALPVLMRAAGSEGLRRYLVLFQNNAERRGGGGFLGSFALLETDGLRVTGFEFRDVYEVDWKQLEKVPPPAGLARYYGGMHLRDANYSPDFPTTARWVEWYYERSGGTTVDGILAVDSSVFVSLLEVLGPVTMPGTDTVLKGEQALDLITAKIETSKDDPAGPKNVLKELMPVLTERLNERARWPALAEILVRAAPEKHVLAFAKDAEMQGLIRQYGFDGAFPDAPEGDELAVVSTNVGGNKSDRYTKVSVTEHATVARDGSIRAAAEIKKTFTLPADFEARIGPLLAGQNAAMREYLRHVLGDGINKDYLRVFVPRGSKIIAVDGVGAKDWDVHEELGRTVVGIHLMTNVGETRVVHLRYELPSRLDFVSNATYRFRVLKQPGVDALPLRHQLSVEPGLLMVGSGSDMLERTFTGRTDEEVAVVITRS